MCGVFFVCLFWVFFFSLFFFKLDFKKKLYICLVVPGPYCGLWDLVPWPGIKPPELGVCSLKHRTTRSVPQPQFSEKFHFSHFGTRNLYWECKPLFSRPMLSWRKTRVSWNTTKLSYQDPSGFFLITHSLGCCKLLVFRVPMRLNLKISASLFTAFVEDQTVRVFYCHLCWYFVVFSE